MREFDLYVSIHLHVVWACDVLSVVSIVVENTDPIPRGEKIPSEEWEIFPGMNWKEDRSTANKQGPLWHQTFEVKLPPKVDNWQFITLACM
jgi:hypothetical protein